MGRHTHTWCKILVVLAFSMAILEVSNAHDDVPVECDGNAQEDYVMVHNCIRRWLFQEPLTYSAEMEGLAQAWADQRTDCKLTHGDRCGENMAMGPCMNITDGVQMWLDEKRDYCPKENKCVGGKPCNHYTQIVWANTKTVGCARAACDDGSSYVVVCYYDPPGNIEGERPYELPVLDYWG